MTREPLLADLLGTVLGSHNYVCLVETSPTPAFERFADAPPALTIVDVASLGQAGLDLITDARLIDRGAAIVAIIGRDASTFDAAAYSLGATDIMRRTDDMRPIVDLLESVDAVPPEVPVVDTPATVLVVDDDEAVTRMLARVLTRHGYRVLTASDGARAVQLLESDTIDLLLLDIQLPRLGGMAVLRWLRGRQAPPRVIVISALSGRELKIETLKLGAFDYLEKPLSMDRVLVAASAALALDPVRTRSVWQPWTRRRR